MTKIKIRKHGKERRDKNKVRKELEESIIRKRKLMRKMLDGIALKAKTTKKEKENR